MCTNILLIRLKKKNLIYICYTLILILIIIIMIDELFLYINIKKKKYIKILPNGIFGVEVLCFILLFIFFICIRIVHTLSYIHKLNCRAKTVEPSGSKRF